MDRFSEAVCCGIFALTSRVLTPTEYRLLVQYSPLKISRSGMDETATTSNETWRSTYSSPIPSRALTAAGLEVESSGDSTMFGWCYLVTDPGLSAWCNRRVR